jgi:uncharacterized protein DUF4136
MRQTTLGFIALMTLLCSSASLIAQEVKYNYDRETNFAAYRSYRWTGRERTAPDPLVDRDIRRAIDAQLSQKGLQKSENDSDLYIDYQTAVDHERQFDAWNMGPRWSGMARATTSRVDVGTLVLSIYDPVKKQLAWRGSVTKTLNPGKDPDKNYRNLEKAIAKLLKNYPPKSRK